MPALVLKKSALPKYYDKTSTVFKRYLSSKILSISAGPTCSLVIGSKFVIDGYRPFVTFYILYCSLSMSSIFTTCRQAKCTSQLVNGFLWCTGKRGLNDLITPTARTSSGRQPREKADCLSRGSSRRVHGEALRKTQGSWSRASRRARLFALCWL